MIIDTVSVSYNSFEELQERQQIIEKTVEDYLEDNLIANRIESNIRIYKDKFILTLDLIKD